TVPQSVETELLGTGSSLAGVQVGEELTAHTLLYLMMVPSGNDAALTLMKYVDEQYALGKIQEPASSALPETSSTAEEPQSQPESGLSSQPVSAVSETSTAPESSSSGEGDK